MAYDRDLADRLRARLSSEPGVSEKAMFGGLAFMIDGHLAVAAGSDRGMMLRCEPADTAELRTRPHAGPMIMRGKELSGWLRVEAEGIDSDADLHRWTDLAVAYARSLSPQG